MKLEHPSTGFPTTGTAFIRKWRKTLVENGGNGNREEKNVTEDSDKKLEWWDPPQDSLVFDFCQDTSLHGKN